MQNCSTYQEPMWHVTVQEGEPLQEESPRRLDSLLVGAPVFHPVVGVTPVIKDQRRRYLDPKQFFLKKINIC